MPNSDATFDFRQESCQKRSSEGSAFSRSHRVLPWRATERILQRYVEIVEGAGTRGHAETKVQAPRRDASAEIIWASTVGRCLVKDPNRVLPRTWGRELEMLLTGDPRRKKDGLQALMPRRDFDALVNTLMSKGRVNVAEKWARADYELVTIEQHHSEAYRLNQRARGAIHLLEEEVRAAYHGWMQLVIYLKGHYAYRKSMDWLGDRFARCRDEDPAFCRHLED